MALSDRVNVRLLTLALVVLLLIGYPMWIFIDSLASGGMWHRKDAHGEYTEVDLRRISLFEFDPLNGTDEQIPPEFRALNGKRVLLEGEMYTSRTAVGAQSDFDLVYSIARCCFVGTPKIQHFVKARVVPGKRVQGYPGLVRVFGTLHVGVERKDGQILSIYRLDVESTEPKR